MRSLHNHIQRTLPERRVDVYEIEEVLDEHLKEEYPDEAYDASLEHRRGGLKVRVYDDRQRYLEECRRQVQQQAASLAQRHLEIAHELMRAAGNGVWNSPVGFDRVLSDIMEAVQRETNECLRRGDELRAHALDYQRLLQEGVKDNVARRGAR